MQWEGSESGCSASRDCKIAAQTCHAQCEPSGEVSVSIPLGAVSVLSNAPAAIRALDSFMQFYLPLLSHPPFPLVSAS